MTQGAPLRKRWYNVSLVLLALLAVWLIVVFFGEVQKRDDRTRAAAAHQRATALRADLDAYYEKNRRLPRRIELSVTHALDDPKQASNAAAPGYDITVDDGTITITFTPGQSKLGGKTLVYRPHPKDGKLEWDCRGGNVEDEYRVPECRNK